jgi:putative FmdB family regulatory protein
VPTYSYECTKCGHAFDVFHAMSSTVRVKCEKCNGPCIKMIGKGAGIIFKGSGFYETDYKKKSGVSSSSGSETKGESKPVPTSEKSERSDKSDKSDRSEKKEKPEKKESKPAKAASE